MSYKTLMVHLDSSIRANARVSLALKLARAFGSHLNGVFAAFEPHPREFYVMAGTADYYDAHCKLRVEQRAAIERLFRAELERAQVVGALIDADTNTDIVASLLRHSRSTDLTIIGQANPDDPETFVADNFAETVVLGAGGPVLLVPRAGFFETVGTRVLIGWNGSREAARAVHDAIPFIVRAEHVTIAASSSTFAPAPSQASCSALAAMLARHGATSIDIARFDRHAAETTGDALLNFAVDGGFDLLVMGAYGHARLQELVLGGATRSVLLTAKLPVLMSH
jgi:nucleotide-binding universal stress UspA family protein